MIRGIGNVSFSIYSQTENVQNLRFSKVNLWGQVRTLRGLFLVSRTGDDHPCVDSRTLPCVHSKRPCVYRHHARMLKSMCVCCRHTRRRFECTHGGVLSLHTGFSACHTTHHTHNNNTPHNSTQTHTTTLNDTHTTNTRRQRQRKKTEKDDRERREDEREDKTRQDNTR